MDSAVVSELEGTLLKDSDPFSYFMLMAFEASGLIRFVVLLILWPVIRLLSMVGMEDATLKLMIFVAVAGIPESEIESVARAVLPKFYMDDLEMGAWRMFSSYKKRVVVTKMPRVMVEWFVMEHLRADKVIGSELITRLGFATGLIEYGSIDTIAGKVAKLFNNEETTLGLGRKCYFNCSFLFAAMQGLNLL
ncbi:hypothetical protein L6164_016447 [Bauhinia variegata]|uniref:Uncharacterized protein n=1 Tax=Bauhinia variegata TaxID=167791 RepID=A0ACB9NNN2_BAUVA|nr:hypothetical protein L6164_016447 [Bauhinia variegata]